MRGDLAGWRGRLLTPWNALRRHAGLPFAGLFCLWLLDLPRAAATGEPPLTVVRGLGLALALCTLLAGAIGVVLALITRAAGRDAGARGGTERLRIGAWLWQDEPPVQQSRSAAVLAVLLLAMLAGGLAVLASERAILAFARPRNAALVIALVYVAVGLAALASFGTARAICLPVVRLLGRVPMLGRPFARAGTLIATLGGLGALAAAILVASHWQTLSYLPWAGAATLVGAIALTAAWRWASKRLPNWLATAVRALCVSAGLAALGWSFGTAQSDFATRRVALETFSGRAGSAAVHAALDFDRDGHLPFWGGGDCAPFDPARHPTALEVPRNGIDEDCDGEDLTGSMLDMLTTRHDWRVPTNVPRRPPIVLVTIDTLAARRLGTLGGERGLMPNLDAFAGQSVLFTACFSEGPSTRLSFPSMFTSRWDSEIRHELRGKHPYPIAASEKMLAEVLRRAGYDTTAVISDAYFSKQRWGSLTNGFRKVVDRPIRHKGLHNSAAVTDAAIQEIRQKRASPLFLWAHYYDAHSPHVQPEGVERYGTDRESLYRAELHLVDREVGRLLHAIESELGGAALVIVAADHGIAFDAPRHDRLNYGYDLHTAILHVPLIVHAGYISPRRLDGVVSTMDIAPTITNLLRLGRQPFHGASLVPELLRGERSRAPLLVHEFFLLERLWENADPLEMIALRTDRYNLIHDRRVGTYQLYEWRRDYDEREDLTGTSEHAASYRAMRKQLALLTYELHRAQRTLPKATAEVRR